MAAVTTVRQVLKDASVLLADMNPQFHRYEEADLLAFYNDGAAAVVKYIPTAGGQRIVRKLAAGTRQSIEAIAQADRLHADGSSPSGVMRGISLLEVIRNMGADGATVGRAIRLMDRQDLDVMPDWHTAPNPNRRISGYCFNPSLPLYFDVTPPVPVSGAAMWAEISLLAQPVALTVGTPGEFAWAGGSNNAVIAVRDEFASTLANYIVARALLTQNEWTDAAKAAAFGQSFMQEFNSKVGAYTGTNPNLKRLPLAPDMEAGAS